MTAVRAKYENGVLTPLEPLDLAEGAEVMVSVEGAGAQEAEGGGNPNAIGRSLDDLFGVWSEAEAETFDNALEVFETVDEAAWK